MFDLDRTPPRSGPSTPTSSGCEEVDVHWGERSQLARHRRRAGRQLGMHTGFAPIYDLDPLTAGQPRRAVRRRPALTFPHRRRREPPTSPGSPPRTRIRSGPGARLPRGRGRVRGRRRARLRAPTWTTARDPSVRRAPGRRHRGDPGRGPAQDLTGARRRLQRRAGAPELAGLWTRLPTPGPWPRSTDGGPDTYPAVDPTKRIDFVAVGTGIDVVHASAARTPPSSARATTVPWPPTCPSRPGSETCQMTRPMKRRQLLTAGAGARRHRRHRGGSDAAQAARRIRKQLPEQPGDDRRPERWPRTTGPAWPGRRSA